MSGTVYSRPYFSRPLALRALIWRNRHSDLWTEAFLSLAGKLAIGSLTVRLSSGRVETIQGACPGPHGEIVMSGGQAARALLLGGPVGFAEAYADGLWDSPDLAALMDLAARNQDALGDEVKGWRPLRWLDRLYHLRRANTRGGSRRNIAAHYDLGNAFYDLWLDPGMTYSSGLYETGQDSLEQAQDAKYARAAHLLDVKPGHTVLEIGCGWGGMAEHLTTRHGVAVTGLTLSTEQLAFAKARLKGVADLRLQDYRDCGGTFDRIVSIEMVEAVGEKNWPVYFETLHNRLKPGGKAVIQAITIAEDRFIKYRKGADFIQRHIFPGGMLPSPDSIRREAAKAGLALRHSEFFGESYGKTLAEWRRRFVAAAPQVAALGFDENFRRAWDYYLAYCEGGFRAGTIDVSFWVLEKPRG